MSLFGKILTFLCTLTALAFIVLGLMVWAKRTEAQSLVLRGELAIHGLPWDDKDPGHQNPDEGPLVDRFSKAIITDTFAQAKGGERLGGSEVRTVQEEVKRVRQKAAALVDGAARDEEKKAVLKPLLLDQVSNGTERDALAADLDPKSAVKPDVLVKKLDDLLAAAESDAVPVAPSDGANQKDKALKRLQVAHTLIHLAPRDLEWQQRVAAVVGLRAYNQALDLQATALVDIVARARMILIRDQSNFLNQYRALQQVARDQSDTLAGLLKRLEADKLLLNEQNAISAARKAIVDENTAKLEVARTVTTAALTTQAALEQRIFGYQRAIVIAEDAIAATELKLRELEQKALATGR